MNKCYVEGCNNLVTGYNLCHECIPTYIRICTCNKKFTSVPEVFIFGLEALKHIEYPLPDNIPDYFFTNLYGSLYFLFGCRGCKHKEISIKNNFEGALQASIYSCVYKKYDNVDIEKGEKKYEYLSDCIDTNFEEYCLKNNINIGNVAELNLNDVIENKQLELTNVVEKKQ